MQTFFKVEDVIINFYVSLFSRYAWLLDGTDAERERGITIENTVHKTETKRREITISNIPGHPDFIENFLTGIQNIREYSSINLISP